MTSDDLGERVARLEAFLETTRETADRAHARIDMQGADIIETAGAAGRSSAKSYMEGLKESFIKDTAKRLTRHAIALVALYVLFSTVMGFLGIRIYLVPGLLP